MCSVQSVTNVPNWLILFCLVVSHPLTLSVVIFEPNDVLCQYCIVCIYVCSLWLFSNVGVILQTFVWSVALR